MLSRRPIVVISSIVLILVGAVAGIAAAASGVVIPIDANGNVKVHEQGTAQVAGTVNVPAQNGRVIQVVPASTIVSPGTPLVSPVVPTADCRSVTLYYSWGSFGGGMPDVPQLLPLASNTVPNPGYSGNDRAVVTGTVIGDAGASSIDDGIWAASYLVPGTSRPVTAPYMAMLFSANQGSQILVRDASLYCER